MDKIRYTELWDLQPQIEESLYECGGMYYADTCEDAQIEIEEAYGSNKITREQCEELLTAMDLNTDIDWEDLDKERAKNISNNN